MSRTPEQSKAAAQPAQQAQPEDQCTVATDAARPADIADTADAHADSPGSRGDNPLSVTPKDVTPGDATARDLVARHLDSSDPDEKQQALLDDAIDLSFPASDPPAVAGGITRIDKPAHPSA